VVLLLLFIVKCKTAPRSAFIMATLHSRWDIIFLPCGLFFCLLSIFFPHLISAVADWMSAILPHMVWLYCKFRMQVWNVLLQLAENTGLKKVAKNRHLGTIAQLCRAISSQLRYVSTIGKKTLVIQQYLLHMS